MHLNSRVDSPATFTIKLHESTFPLKSVAVYVMVRLLSSKTRVVLAFLGETTNDLIPALSAKAGRLWLMRVYLLRFKFPGQLETVGAVVSIKKTMKLRINWNKIPFKPEWSIMKNIEKFSWKKSIIYISVGLYMVWAKWNFFQSFTSTCLSSIIQRKRQNKNASSAFCSEVISCTN